jgi:hypothetical protein
MGHILLTCQKKFYEFVPNLIHLSLVVELTYLIAGNGQYLENRQLLCFHMSFIYVSFS